MKTVSPSTPTRAHARSSSSRCNHHHPRDYHIQRSQSRQHVTRTSSPLHLSVSVSVYLWLARISCYGPWCSCFWHHFGEIAVTHTQSLALLAPVALGDALSFSTPPGASRAHPSRPPTREVELAGVPIEQGHTSSRAVVAGLGFLVVAFSAVTKVYE